MSLNTTFTDMSILRNDYFSNFSSYLKTKGYDVFVICKSRVKPEEPPQSAGTMSTSDAEVICGTRVG